MRLILTTATLLTIAASAHAENLHDDFDGFNLDAKKWSTTQIQPHQIDFLESGRCGPSAIIIITKEGDGGLDCPDEEQNSCQRAEIRTGKAYLPTYGNEVWYAFSLKIDAEVPETGSSRTVIGQWKAPGDDSPFVAQRFDNGVFHVTVQDNDTRRVVAKAEGNPDRLVAAERLLANLDRNDSKIIGGITNLQILYLLKQNQPELSRQLLSDKTLESLNGGSTTTGTASELAGLLDLPSGEIVSTFSELAFVAEPEKYLGKADIEIIPEANRLLPDPRKGWVDMLYRIKGGRTDNEYGPKDPGELDIWANGQKIVSVKGNIGYQLVLEHPVDLVGPYFKFGLYRKKIPSTFEFQFDEFSQAASRAELALPPCD